MHIRVCVAAHVLCSLALVSGPLAHAQGAATAVDGLVAEALAHNAEIAAARAGQDAAGQRIRSSGALDDPMVELGIVNAPLPFSLRREDMTMKMLGLSQKLPFPGKRDLRREVARADADSVAHAVDETIDRVVRDVRVAYEELRFAVTSAQLVDGTLVVLRQLGTLAESRYALGQATQSDVLQAQAQAARMQQELLRLRQEEAMRRSDLDLLLGRTDPGAPPVVPTATRLVAVSADPGTLVQLAEDGRPQLQALGALVAKSERELALARREYWPDFEVRFGYGQRDPTPEGSPRDDMVTLTVALNLPLWRQSRLEPRVAEAQALRRQAISLAESQRQETRAGIARAVATVNQQRQSAMLYRTTLLPQTEAAFEAALAAYRVGRADFLTLLEARMRLTETALGEAEAIAGHNKAVADIDFLTGRVPTAAAAEVHQP